MMLTGIETNFRTIKFKPVRIDETRPYVCADCGVKKSRKRTFEQTINPFNVNADGDQKTRTEIIAELREEASSWLPDPHCGCTRDERPEKRFPDIKPTAESLNVDALMDQANEHYAAIKCIENELKQRFEGLRIKVKSDGRMGYIRELHLDRWGGSPKISLFPWLEQKKNPKLEYGDGHNQGLLLSEVELILGDGEVG